MPEKLEKFTRWFFTLVCAVSVGYILGAPGTCDNNITTWDRVEGVAILWLFTITGWDWAWHLARKNK